MDALDRRLMPEGMEWPRYKSGEMVRIGSDFADGLGETHTVTSIEFFEGCVELHWNPDEPGEFEYLHPGERVKRPAPKVLDADGVEIGIGDKLYDTDTSCARIVRAINADGTVEFEGYEDRGWFTKFLTHRAPVLAADGRPLREGETVYGTGRTQHRFVVRAASDYEEDEPDGRFRVPCVDKDDGDEECWCDPSQLTHERPDSWERLDEDARRHRYDYWNCWKARCSSCPAAVDGKNPRERYGVDDCQDAMQLDLVRRCKALAERERGE